LASKKEDNTAAARLVDQAREAELKGDTARQFAWLREAVRLAPDYQAARWQLGQLEVEGEWLAVEEIQRRAAINPKQSFYRQLRAEQGNIPGGQLALARWCTRNGLKEEAKFHWAGVLATQPSDEEALRALGMRWYEGRLLTAAQIRQVKEQARLAHRAMDQWSARVTKWQRALSGNNQVAAPVALEEIRTLDDSGAIPALEALTLDSDLSNAGRAEMRRKIGEAFVTALARMPEHAATESLVRHAVLAPSALVRGAAADQLRYRSPHDYVPLLLSGLEAPIESWFHVTTDSSGSVHYRHSLYREGSEAKWSLNLRRSANQHDMQGRSFVRGRDGIVRDLGRHRESPAFVAAKATSVAARSIRQYGVEAALIEHQVGQANQVAAINNERITGVLANTTGQEFGNDPKAWADWWQNYNEYYSDGETPSYDHNYVDNRHYYYRVPEVIPQMSCFANGTPVWTKTGLQPIETLELGDLVLAQQVDTGELAYKPVIGRTVRPPSPILRLRLEGDELLTTRGHPFWVTGVGWRMAKELGDGAILHGVSGSPRVAAIESASEEEAYNLVVADFSTYFVGKHGILVHDNTPRRPVAVPAVGLASAK
jgi:hypothetical protein